MSNRYLTHLVAAFFIHLLVLIGSFNIIQEQKLTSSLSLGPSALKLRIATRAIFQPATAPVAISVPRPSALPRKVIVQGPTTKVLEETRLISPAASNSVPDISTLTGKVDGTADKKAIFKAELRAEIEKNKTYPPMARRLGQTGTVVVAFTLLEDGHIIDVRLDKPSRFERLNESALEAVKSVHKFKPIPKEWGQAKMDFTLPVNYLTI